MGRHNASSSSALFFLFCFLMLHVQPFATGCLSPFTVDEYESLWFVALSRRDCLTCCDHKFGLDAHVAHDLHIAHCGLATVDHRHLPVLATYFLTNYT